MNTYPLLIPPDEEGYGVEIPDLPGCHTHAEKWITVMLQDGKPIPEPTPQTA